MKKLPIGIQGFASLREDGYVYVDKSEYIYYLVQQGKAFFLSRPRRFGKSLLISTLKAYWEGKKELFAGLKIEKLLADDPEAWKCYPVFHFDFNGTNYQSERALDKMLDEHLRRWEKEYEITDTT
ncbi:MAG: AAA family ATPase, partial [Lachnospiraceae bacterium]|nr:AAA family ATPase [Lachnospiraceae bacterium]